MDDMFLNYMTFIEISKINLQNFRGIKNKERKVLKKNTHTSRNSFSICPETLLYPYGNTIIILEDGTMTSLRTHVNHPILQMLRLSRGASVMPNLDYCGPRGGRRLPSLSNLIGIEAQTPANATPRQVKERNEEWERRGARGEIERESIPVQIDRVRSAKVALIPATRPHQSDPRHWQFIEMCAPNHFIFFRSSGAARCSERIGAEPAAAVPPQLVTSLVPARRYSAAASRR